MDGEKEKPAKQKPQKEKPQKERPAKPRRERPIEAAEVFVPGEQKVTYVKMTAEKAARVVEEHIVGGNVVKEYTIGANAK